MSDKFDPYREALVVEVRTVWSSGLPELAVEDKEQIASQLHRDPASCTCLEYVRLHTGFCRQITVTPQDIERLRLT